MAESYIRLSAVRPSSLDFCSSGFVIDQSFPSIVTARVSAVEVYLIAQESGQSFLDNTGKNSKLYLFRRLPVFDEIAGLNVIRRPGKNLDSILLSFKTAKVCISIRKKYLSFSCTS